MLVIKFILLIFTGYLAFPPMAFSLPPQGWCGDQVCDQFELANPDLCPQDCGEKTIAVESPLNIQQISRPSQNENSPFGLHEVRFYAPDEPAYFRDLGAGWARIAPRGSIIWDMIETEKGKYNWTVTDKVLTAANQAGAYLFVTAGFQNRLDSGTTQSRKMPQDMNWFLDFLKKAVERYDGDGFDDAPGSPKIDVIQIGNEIDGKMFWNDTPKNYALLLRKCYQVIKEASPQMKVALAGVATPRGFFDFYRLVFDELARLKTYPDERFFDVFDFHWSGQFKGDYSTIELPGGTYELTNYLHQIKLALKGIGHDNAKIYITEMSDYSDTPERFPTHTEREQAISLFKRYIYSLFAGVDKVFWAQIIEQHSFAGEMNSYFDNVGLVNNPRNDGRSYKKLAYFTYKKMLKSLEGCDWQQIKEIPSEVGVHAYLLTKNGKKIWILWNDESVSKQIDINSLEGKVDIIDAVPDYENGETISDDNPVFVSRSASAVDGNITISLSDMPLIVAETNE